MSKKQKNVPKLRFPGFTGEWVLKSVGEMTEEDSNYTTLESRLPLFTSSRSGLIYQNQYRSSQTTESKETLFSIVPYGHCTYRHMSDDDVFHLNINTLEKGLVSREYPVFHANETNRLDFLVQHMNSSERFRAFCKGQKKGGTRTRLYYKALCEFKMLVPTIDEQNRVADFLREYDTLITLQQRKLDQIKEYKKGMLQKMFPKEGESVPEVRLPGFTGEWKQKKLSELFDYLQNNTLSRADLDSKAGIAKNVHYGDVLTLFDEYLDVSEASLPFIKSQQVVDKFRNSLLNNGDVIMADTAEDETVGKCTEIGGIHNCPVISGLHTIPLRPKSKFASGFLGFYMNSNLYHDQLKPLMQGIKVTAVSKSAIQNTVISYPSELTEQEAIAQLFINLNKYITLNLRKLEEMKEYKKGLLQQMFV